MLEKYRIKDAHTDEYEKLPFIQSMRTIIGNFQEYENFVEDVDELMQIKKAVDYFLHRIECRKKNYEFEMSKISNQVEILKIRLKEKPEPLFDVQAVCLFCGHKDTGNFTCDQPRICSLCGRPLSFPEMWIEWEKKENGI